MFEIKIFNSIEINNNLKFGWNSLVDELSSEVSVFGSLLWYELWLKNYNTGFNLNFMTMLDNDKVVGISPLLTKRSTFHGFPVIITRFIENRNSLHNDFIVLPQYRELFLREIVKTLFEQSSQWDVLFLKNLPITSPNYVKLVQILNETNRKWIQGPTFNSPYLLPAGSWADYLASRSARTRKSLRNIQNSIHKAGDVKVENIRTWEKFEFIREELFSVASQSWTNEIGDSLSTPQNKAFFNDLALRASEKGWLSVWVLYLNGQMIAFEFHLKGCGKDHAMRGSYLPEFAKLSPGTYLEMQILKDAFEGQDPVQKYDFGGSFDSYKKKWTDDATPHCELTLFNNNSYSRLVAFHEMKTVPLVKRVRDKIRQAKS